MLLRHRQENTIICLDTQGSEIRALHSLAWSDISGAQPAPALSPHCQTSPDWQALLARPAQNHLTSSRARSSPWCPLGLMAPKGARHTQHPLGPYCWFCPYPP